MFPWLLVLHFIGQSSDVPGKSVGMYNMEACFGLSCKTIYFIQLSEGLLQKQKSVWLACIRALCQQKHCVLKWWL